MTRDKARKLAARARAAELGIRYTDVLRRARRPQSPAVESTKIVSFIGLGGVGKTDTVLGVADILSRRGRNVLVIDADPQATAQASLLGPLAESDFTTPRQAPWGSTRIDVVTSSDRRLADVRIDRSRYGHVLIDMPPGFEMRPYEGSRVVHVLDSGTAPGRVEMMDQAAAVDGYVLTKTGRFVVDQQQIAEVVRRWELEDVDAYETKSEGEGSDYDDGDPNEALKTAVRAVLAEMNQRRWLEDTAARTGRWIATVRWHKGLPPPDLYLAVANAIST